jgi:CHAD domain-containing protein
MRRFALEQIAALIDRLAREVERTARDRDAEAVHDLRVTIRRFGQSLRVFSPFVPKRQAKKIRKRLRHIMTLAGEVRNRDITMDLIAEAGLPQLRDAVQQDRDLAARILAAELNRWLADNDALRWRAALELPAE